VTIFSHLRFPITRVPTDCCFQVKSSPCRIRRTVLDNPLLRLQILSEGWIAATLYVAYLKVSLIAQQKCQEVNIPISLAKTWKGNTKFRIFPDSGYFFSRFQVKQKDVFGKIKSESFRRLIHSDPNTKPIPCRYVALRRTTIGYKSINR
jgi:hypothetical protein